MEAETNSEESNRIATTNSVTATLVGFVPLASG